MRIAVLVVAVTLSLSAARAPLAAQEQQPRPERQPGSAALYFELLGSGGLWSVNLERASKALRFRAGFATWTATDWWSGSSQQYTTLPLTLTYVLGDGNHHLETGGGVTFGARSASSGDDFYAVEGSSRFVTLTTAFGYRYQKPGAGFVFRAMLTPMYGIGSLETAYPDKGYFPSLGLSFGRAF